MKGSNVPGAVTPPRVDYLSASLTPPQSGCPECGCTNPGCENGCKVSKIDEIHAWLAEVMPAARLAVKMMNARNKLLGRWVKDAGRND